MNLIGFSYHYTKIQEQVFGKLIYAEPTNISRYDIGSDWFRYDTAYKENGVTLYCDFIEPDVSYARLVFLGNRNIPFTTYRKCNNIEVYKNLIDTEFVFKFRGATIPDGLKPPSGKYNVMIYDTIISNN